MGSTNTDYGRATTVDGDGNVYVAGYSYATWGSPVNDYVGDSDAFAVKLDSNGNFVWNTFMGSSSGDLGYGIAVDHSGNVYLTGHSYETWGSPVNAYAGGMRDIFEAKLSSSVALIWNTFFGTPYNDGGKAIAEVENGNVYVTGYSYGNWGTPINAHVGGADAFVAKQVQLKIMPWGQLLLLYDYV